MKKVQWVTEYHTTKCERIRQIQEFDDGEEAKEWIAIEKGRNKTYDPEGEYRYEIEEMEVE